MARYSQPSLSNLLLLPKADSFIQNDFISKPFDPQSLIREVRRLVEQARGEPVSMLNLDTEPSADATG
jgi:DNA-binding response OmpR family regulator